MADFSIAVEGNLDEAVLECVLRHCGHGVSRVYGRSGKESLLRKVGAYSQAARHSPWIMLVDLDQQECAPTIVRTALESCPPGLIFRVAVREIEAWLLADRSSIAALLGVARTVVPADPESLDDPKQTLVNLARRSRFRQVREDLVPSEGSGRSEGPGYSSRLSDFAAEVWDVSAAVDSADSLKRCVAALGSRRSAVSNSCQTARVEPAGLEGP